MTSYVFSNRGVIDPMSITTFGVSSKEGKNPIGFFGTGLKYAIAVLLRTGCSVTVLSGDKTYKFTTKNVKIRVDDFDVVHMNDQTLGFTTELGKTWELWQAFRELACNALDEGGEYFRCDDANGVITEFVNEPDVTQVVVTGRPFADAWNQRHSVLLTGTPTHSTEDLEIHRGASSWVYYRGVRAHKLAHPATLTYNVLRKMDITEDRTIKNSWVVDETVTKTIQLMTDRQMIRKLVTTPEGAYETQLYYSPSRRTSQEFQDEVLDLAKKFDKNLNPSAKELCSAMSLALLLKGSQCVLSKIDERRLEFAKSFLLKLGYDVSEYPLVVTDHLGEGVLGAAQDGTIYISKRAFMLGTKVLAGTLYEEYTHLKHDVSDCTRQMQNFLIDALMSLGEQLTGEPL